MKVCCSKPPLAVAEPTVAKLAFGGFPALPSCGGVAELPFGFGDVPGVQVTGVTSLLDASLVARWMAKVKTTF